MRINWSHSSTRAQQSKGAPVSYGLMENSGTATGSRPKEVFSQAVLVVLQNWNALQIAVDNQFGGQFTREKAEWLRKVTADYFWDNGTYKTIGKT